MTKLLKTEQKFVAGDKFQIQIVVESSRCKKRKKVIPIFIDGLKKIRSETIVEDTKKLETLLTKIKKILHQYIRQLHFVQFW